MSVESIRWQAGLLSIIDQTLLPEELSYIELGTAEAVDEAIKKLRVRGAPAIGCCAAYGVIVGIRSKGATTVDEAVAVGEVICDYLAESRPTAVNLGWAITRMRECLHEAAADATSVAELLAALDQEARAIFADNVAVCRAIGDAGAEVMADGDGVLTHCNTGPLATGAEGTALACIYRAHGQGKNIHVYADETRPLLQGARLTTWELQQQGIPVTLICDNAAAVVMRERKVQLAIVGADRITANGDAANKIGTYGVAVLAKAHGIPFYVAAPYSTFDLSLEHGDTIPIEYREANEVTHGFGKRTAPEGVAVYSPAFDVTPAELITGIITEHGILRPPYTQSIAASVGESHAQSSAR